MNEKSKSAFAHDEASVEINPKKPVKESKWNMFKILTIAVGLLGLIIMYLLNSGESSAEKHTKKALTESPEITQRETEKIITLTTNWSAMVFVHTDEKFEAHILDLNCWWEVRFNGSKVYTLYPVNNDPNPKMVAFKEIVSSLEWRIVPGPVKSAKLNYRIFKNG